MGFQITDFELNLATMLLVLALNKYIVHHIADDSVHIFKLQVPFATVRALLLALFPNVHALFAKATLTTLLFKNERVNE
jgi:hypothetical protein